MHEILTLQLGHRANHIATHFWNTQESYFTYGDEKVQSVVDHDIHFRVGLGPSGEETFTPRTLIYDLKRGYGSMKRGAGLYEESENIEPSGAENSTWKGNLILQKETPIPPSKYQQSLNEGNPNPQKPTPQTIEYWSDYSRVFYHPRSVVQINDYDLGSSLMPFEKWECGEEIFSEMDQEDDIMDRDLRFWVEECDLMQGVQMFMSADDAWGGFTARYLERMRDEFAKSEIWIWGIEEEYGAKQRAKALTQAVNAAKSIHDITVNASIYVPLSIPHLQLPPYINMDRRLEWHTSGLLSMSLETMTFPSRLRLSHKRGDFRLMQNVLNTNGSQRIANLQCSIIDPLSAESKEIPVDHRMPVSNSSGWEPREAEPGTAHRNLDMDFSCGPERPSQDHVFGRIESLRGSPNPQVENYKDEGFTRKRRRLSSLPIVQKYETSTRFPLLDSFPDIVSQRANHSNSVAILTTLSTTTRSSSRIKYLRKIVDRNVSMDVREALSNGLGEIGEAYEEGWDSGSDDDSDD